MSYLTQLIERLGQALRPAKAAPGPPEAPVSIHEPVHAPVEQPTLHESAQAPVEDLPEEPSLAEPPAGRAISGE
jgi:hypothetical protein